MTSFAELVSTFREDFATRYRSPVLIPFALAFVAVHWRVLVFATAEQQRAAAMIEFIEKQVTLASTALALAYAIAYVLLTPWLELAVSRIAFFGKKKRNEFQYGEQQQAISRRKVIAHQQEALIELEMRNAKGESALHDTDLVKQYHSHLSAENLARWVNDLKAGPVNSQLESAIINYLAKYDTVEGRFVSPEIDKAHSEFVSALSTLGSAISDTRTNVQRTPLSTVQEFGNVAVLAQKQYRSVAREHLGI